MQSQRKRKSVIFGTGKITQMPKMRNYFKKKSNWFRKCKSVGKVRKFHG